MAFFCNLMTLTLSPFKRVETNLTMSLNNQIVDNIAHLARLKIDASETDKYCVELSNILTLVEQMAACDTSDVEPMTHPFDATLRLRDDLVSEHDQRNKFQTIAPETSEGLYLVPKVID
jgi:aspartyl-tRNA(Asn)/glutamyl-tRNA(Gln) amidotransferase subunit C